MNSIKFFGKSLLAAIVIIGLSIFYRNLSTKKYLDQPVQEINIDKYMGWWYEIAEIPFYWGKNCFCTNAYYEFCNNTNTIIVKNSCRYDNVNNSVSTWTGSAWPTDNSTGKLKVKFSAVPSAGDYWILEVAKDYSYALIGHPTKDYLWILSRTPILDEAIYNKLIIKAKNLGYETEKIVKTDHSCYKLNN